MIKKVIQFLSDNEKLRDNFPPILRKLARSIFPLEDYNLKIWERSNPYVNTPYEWEYKGETDFTMGIIYDASHYHSYYQSACLDFKISYKVIDITCDKWIENIEDSNCVGFLQWPHIFRTPFKTLFDERLKLIKETLHFNVYPGYEEIWTLDNKRRVRDWLKANKYPIPETHVFFDKQEAIAFIHSAKFPLVYKTINGSVSRGVEIIRSKDIALKFIHDCFGKGVTAARMDKRDKQWGQIVFQEYIEDVHERRMIRIGEYYLSIDKVKKGDFHSGSGKMLWGDNDRYFLDMTKDVTERGNFRSMNVDFFISKEGRKMINEMHSLFRGPVITDLNNKGAYTYDKVNDKWDFIAGNYYRNYCCNLRVIDFLTQLNLIDKIDTKSWLDLPAFGYHEVDK